MTRNESFKKRVRARMAKTGEKYGAARRVLVEQAARRSPGGWVSEPPQSDAVIKEHTGRGLDAWRELIESWPGHSDGHGAVAAWLQSQHGVDGWWAQSVTVGWERISGRRLPHQMADGTFTANVSATMQVDPAALRELLLDDGGRADLFRGLDPTLRSRPTSKSIGIGLVDGVAQFSIVPKANDRATVYVAHEKLTSPEAVAHWKSFWSEWLRSLDDAASPAGRSGVDGTDESQPSGRLPRQNSPTTGDEEHAWTGSHRTCGSTGKPWRRPSSTPPRCRTRRSPT
jgi:hypothetical protein